MSASAPRARHRSGRTALGNAGLALVAIAFAAACASGAGSSTDASAGAAPPVATGSAPVGPSLAVASTAPSPTQTEVAAVSPSSSPLAITSTAFEANQPIPAEFTCRGADRSPPLAWAGVPPGTGALVLFVDDPDGRNWVHWSVLDLDPATTSLPAGVSSTIERPQQGTNDFGRVGYGGPCPPSGTHHYRFTLSALDAPLGLRGHPDGAAVRAALAKAHVLDQVTLVGTFKA